MSTVSWQEKDGVIYVSINKPPANAYDITHLRALRATFLHLDAEVASNVVVLQSGLDKFFCAGSDIKVFAKNTTAENQQMTVVAREVCAAIEKSKKLFIAAISGHALGGGLEIALACDFRLAATGQYLLGLPEIKLGLIPGNGGTVRLARLIGKSRAAELLMFGEPINADQALSWGLVNRVYERSAFWEEVHAFAYQLSLGPKEALAALKDLLQANETQEQAEALRTEAQAMKRLLNSPDAEEGFKAYIEKRPPKFSEGRIIK